MDRVKHDEKRVARLALQRTNAAQETGLVVVNIACLLDSGTKSDEAGPMIALRYE
jgi:hypothetical protein